MTERSHLFRVAHALGWVVALLLAVNAALALVALARLLGEVGLTGWCP